MTKLAGWRNATIMLVLFAIMTIPSAAQTLTTLATFNGLDGSFPYTAPLVQGVDGNFYGTTTYGGANCPTVGCGIVFKISTKGILTILYSFCAQPSCTDGTYPFAGLIQATDGNLYGTTTQGGEYGGHGGTVFKITPAGKLTTLYSFCAQTNCADGNYPTGGLIQGADGNFYGTTFSGGIGDAQYCNGGCGTIFKITPKGTLTTRHNFAGYPTEGSGPSAGLMQARNGNFYGTTTFGGAYNTCSQGCNGTVFEITPGGDLTTLHSFTASPTEGAAPYAGVVLGNDGRLYGTTSAGGAGNYGTIFKITPAGVLATIYNFCSQGNCADGGQPEAGLALGTDGNFYGTAVRGGLYQVGSIFKITPGGALTTLYSFCSSGYPACPDGSFVYAGLIQATNGNLYGSTSAGGDSSCDFGYGCGSVFSLSVGLAPFVQTLPAAGKVGSKVAILGTNLTGATSVMFNGTSAPFSIPQPSLILTNVPAGSTSGYITVSTPGGTLKSNAQFYVIP
jgi:uncharacterized repeat protein (TIGR03803 family)